MRRDAASKSVRNARKRSTRAAFWRADIRNISGNLPVPRLHDRTWRAGMRLGARSRLAHTQQGASIDSKDDQSVARHDAHIRIARGSPRHDVLNDSAAPGAGHRLNKEITMSKARDAAARRVAPLDTPADLRANAVPEISGALNILLADMFALYLKTKNFHWHVSGPHFRDYHLLL